MVKQRRKCKVNGCYNILYPQNKSGFCKRHQSFFSETVKEGGKRYAKKRGKGLVIAYTRALSILKERHWTEFYEIYEELKNKLEGQNDRSLKTNKKTN